MAVNLVEALGAAERSTTNCITLYVPSCDRDNEPLDADLCERWIRDALALLSDIGGGATRLPPAQGAWRNPESGQLVVEAITLVYSYVDADRLTARLPELRAFLHGMGRELDQGEVIVEVNDTVYKIRAYDP